MFAFLGEEIFGMKNYEPAFPNCVLCDRAQKRRIRISQSQPPQIVLAIEAKKKNFLARIF